MALAHVGSHGHDPSDSAQRPTVRERDGPSDQLGALPRNTFSLHCTSLAPQVVGPDNTSRELSHNAKYSLSIVDKISAGA